MFLRDEAKRRIPQEKKKNEHRNKFLAKKHYYTGPSCSKVRYSYPPDKSISGGERSLFCEQLSTG